MFEREGYHLQSERVFRDISGIRIHDQIHDTIKFYD